jgi:hypothetical protein
MNRTLPNGNEIVAIDFDAGFVLSSNEKNRGTEYITHSFYRGDLASTSGGHYFDDIEEARKDFNFRIGRGY